MKIKENTYLSVGIDPAGIGVTGIIIKTYNTAYPKKWHIELHALNPVEAFKFITTWIEEKQKFYLGGNIPIKDVVVELLHHGNEKFKQVKATRELIGMLRLYYGSKFKGHTPDHKYHEEIKKLNIYSNGKKTHFKDAEAILYAHFLEEKIGLSCEQWNLEVKNNAKKK